VNGSPGAGWYTDPSDPSQQRWWGGVEWTHDVRPLQAPVAPIAVAPALSHVPGGGINPFAEIDALEAAWAAPEAGARVAPAAASTASGFEPYGGNAGWQAPAPRFAPSEPPSNGYATAGLILSLVWLQLFGVIFSIIGLVRASNLTHEGAPPVGRKRAIWGLVLGLAGPLVLGVLTAIAVPIYLGQQQQALDAQQQVAEELDVSVDEVLTEADGSPVVYDRAEYEQLIADSFAKNSDGATLDWIECPDSVNMVVGVEISCKFAYQAVTHVFSVTITDNEGNATATIDGRPIQQ
jgi:hypothetical protein